jgi:hypothetical protein
MKTAKLISFKSKAGRVSHRRPLGAYPRGDGERRVNVNVTLLPLPLPMPVPKGHVINIPVRNSHAASLRVRAEQVRTEFSLLAEQWRRDTQHLSQISKKVAHPAYFRIMGMGERAVPLILEALRDRPAYWFAALKATANVDPVPVGANPSVAREAWLDWGRKEELVD